MTIDQLHRGSIYTVHYEAGEEVTDFMGCKFDGIVTWETESESVRGVVMSAPGATPSPAVFWEPRIRDIVPE